MKGVNSHGWRGTIGLEDSVFDGALAIDMKTLVILFLTTCGAFAEQTFINIGSLGRSPWSPSSNEIAMAYSLAEHYCRYKLSDQHMSYLHRTNDVEIEVVWHGTVNTDAPKSQPDTDMPDMVPESFTIRGVLYLHYTREIRAFLQPYGKRELKMLAVLHRPPSDSGSVKSEPFTIYFNTDTGDVGTKWNIFPIILYSPGPPFSFIRKGDR